MAAPLACGSAITGTPAGVSAGGWASGNDGGSFLLTGTASVYCGPALTGSSGGAR